MRPGSFAGVIRCMDDMRVVIFGATGNIGSCTRALSDAGIMAELSNLLGIGALDCLLPSAAAAEREFRPREGKRTSR